MNIFKRALSTTTRLTFKNSTIIMTSQSHIKNGEFVRQTSGFRNHISASPGAEFPPEKGRYHLYVSYACPWAHRTLITRKLKGLEDIISVDVVDPFLDEGGWKFTDEFPDTVNGSSRLMEIYKRCDPDYSLRVTVPTLWDKKTGQIVNNESSDIIRFLYTEFNELIDDPEKKALNLYQEKDRAQIDELNEWIYDTINNGVYKSGFAQTQVAYEKNVTKLFESLDRVEKILEQSEGDYLLGKELTEADLRLYPTIVRFDPVYVQHFKCNIRDIRSGYPHINKWLRNLYWNNAAFHDTTNFKHIKDHYTQSHKKINPFGITPVGPLPNILPL